MHGDASDVRAWAQRVWPDHDWSAGAFRHGAFHEVLVLPGGPVARITDGPGHEERSVREARVAALLAEVGLPVAVPAVLSAPATRDGRTGVLTSLVRGDHRAPTTWTADRDDVLTLLEALGAVDGDGIARALPPPRQWCGGPSWPRVVAERLVPRLPPPAQAPALAAVAAVLELERTAQPGLVHGDLGPHNLLWTADTLTGLLDTDHASWADPAIDVAPLVGVFGADQLRRDVTPEVLRRAMVHRATLPLQVAAAADLAGRATLRDHALGNLARRVAHGTLHDPGGTRPE